MGPASDWRLNATRMLPIPYSDRSIREEIGVLLVSGAQGEAPVQRGYRGQQPQDEAAAAHQTPGCKWQVVVLRAQPWAVA
jgi:hypothetical protein